MLRREAYLDRVVGEVEDLAARVALLKGRFAKQKVNVKLEHYWELEYVRTTFAEFRRRVQRWKMRRATNSTTFKTTLRVPGKI
jgi:hypothetical protein